MRRTLLATAVVTLPLAAMPQPSAAEWTIDTAHTQILFSVDHLGFTQVRGVFRDYDGTVAFDPENLEATEVSLAIDAASVDTLWEARDEHIRSADFLDAANHPEITFVSTGVAATGDNAAEITGDLTIRGETRPVTLAATLNNLGPNPFMPDQEIAGFTLTGEVDRTEFGIDFGAPAIGAVLPVEITVELVRAN
jgi:polyisoprenoid-binding protein YceI